MTVPRRGLESASKVRENLSVLLQEHNPLIALLTADENWFGKRHTWLTVLSFLKQLKLSLQGKMLTLCNVKRNNSIHTMLWICFLLCVTTLPTNP